MTEKTDEGFEMVSVADFLRDVPLRSPEYDLDESQAEVDRLRAEVARLRGLLNMIFNEYEGGMYAHAMESIERAQRELEAKP